MFRPLRAALVCALVLVVSGALNIVAGAAPGDKELAPVRGTVGYEPTVNAPFNRIFGRAVVPDDAVAVTQDASLGTLTLPDSSQVALGERTRVQVGAFNSAAAGPGSTLTIYHGAMRFAIGTTAYLITGDDGTQLICVDCAPGDVTITIGQRIVQLVSGYTITIVGPPGFATFTITRNDQSYNPAVAQFLVLLPKPDFPGAGGGTDPTGYLVTGITHTGAGAWWIPVAVGGAIAGTIIANANNTPHGSPPPAPQPTPSPSPSPTGYSSLQVSTNLLTFNSVGGPPQTFTVQQTGPNGSITIGAPNCNGDGASASDSPPSVPITPTSTAQTVSVSAIAAPTVSPAPTYACSITVTGGNGQTATVNLDITSTAVGVHSGHRNNGTSAAPADTPTPAPAPPGRPPHP
jgi:hypothetical protein